MNPEELKQLLDDPKRILNIARVFHSVLHELEKMEIEKANQAAGNPPGVAKMALSDKVELTLKDKDGNIKAQKTEKEVKK